MYGDRKHVASSFSLPPLTMTSSPLSTKNWKEKMGNQIVSVISLKIFDFSGLTLSEVDTGVFPLSIPPPRPLTYPPRGPYQCRGYQPVSPPSAHQAPCVAQNMAPLPVPSVIPPMAPIPAGAPSVMPHGVMLIGLYPDTTGLPTTSDRQTVMRTQT
jgi:hypothetical protein